MAIGNHHEAYSCLFKFIQKFPNLKLGMVISWYLSILWLFIARKSRRLLVWKCRKCHHMAHMVYKIKACCSFIPDFSKIEKRGVANLDKAPFYEFLTACNRLMGPKTVTIDPNYATFCLIHVHGSSIFAWFSKKTKKGRGPIFIRIHFRGL